MSESAPIAIYDSPEHTADLELRRQQESVQQDIAVQAQAAELATQIPTVLIETDPSKKPLTETEKLLEKELVDTAGESNLKAGADTPTGDELLAKLKIGMADKSTAIHANARDYAAEQMNRETTQKGVKGFLKRVWQGNIARDYYNLKNQSKARKIIVGDGNDPSQVNIYAAQGGTADQDSEASKVIVNNLLEDYMNDRERDSVRSIADIGMHENATEPSEGQKLEVQIKQAVMEYAASKVPDSLDNLIEIKKRLVNDLSKQVNSADSEKGLAFADNIIEVAQNAKIALDHFTGVGRLSDEVATKLVGDAIDIKVGEADMGVRSETKYNVGERAMQMLKDKKIGIVLNESVLISVVGLAAAIGTVTTKKATSALTKAFSLGAAGGLLAARREWKQIKEDRTHHSRSMAEGGGESLIRSNKRRESIEATRYKTQSAEQLISRLGETSGRAGDNAEGLKDALRQLSLAKARMSISDRDRVDLITYSSKTSVESERRDLNMKIAEARVLVKRALESADDTTLKAAGIEFVDPGTGKVDSETKENPRDLAAVLKNMTARTETILKTIGDGEGNDDGGMTDRDRTFKKLQIKRAAAAAVLGFVAGEVIGTGVQEVRAAISGNMQGIFESNVKGDEVRSMLAGLFRSEGNGTPNIVDESTITTNHGIPVLVDHQSNAKVGVPEGYKLGVINNHDALIDTKTNKAIDVSFDSKTGAFDANTLTDLKDHGFKIGSSEANVPGFTGKIVDENGRWSFTSADGHTVAAPKELDLSKLPKSGHLSPAQLNELQQKYHVTLKPIKPEAVSSPTVKTVHGSAKNYIDHHKYKFNKVSRSWDDNDTPNNPDYNENDIWWGGADNKGVDAQGNIVLSAAHMTNEGSWQQGTSVQAKDLINEGKMKFAVSMSRDTQSQVEFLPTGKDGNVTIEKGSDLYKNLFKVDSNGQAHFEGGYIEADKLDGIKNGVQSVHVLATVTGSNSAHDMSWQETTPGKTPPQEWTINRPDTHYTVTTIDGPGEITPGTPELPTVVPPVFPIYGRRGLAYPDESADTIADVPQLNSNDLRPANEPSPVYRLTADQIIQDGRIRPTNDRNGIIELAPRPGLELPPMPDTEQPELEAKLTANEDAPEAYATSGGQQQSNGQYQAQTADNQATTSSMTDDRISHSDYAEGDIIDGTSEVISDQPIQDESREPIVVSPVRAELSAVPRRKELEAAPSRLQNSQSVQANALQDLQSWVAADRSRLQTRREVTNENGQTTWVESDGSPVARSVERERTSIQAYLNEQNRRDESYMAAVVMIGNAMGAMPESNRVAINIPIWNGMSDIGQLLPQYVFQKDRDGNDLPADTFEINILMSHDIGTDRSPTESMVDQFVNEFEEQYGHKPPINFYVAALEPSVNGPGYVRKLLNDVVLSRSLNRPNQTGPLYIDVEDNVAVEPADNRTVVNLLSTFDKHPELDAVAGVEDRANPRVLDNDMLLLRSRSEDFLSILASQKSLRNPKAPEWNSLWNKVETRNANTGVTAEAYALIGGDDVHDVSEGGVIGKKIAMVRGDGEVPNLEVVGRVGTRSLSQDYLPRTEEALTRIDAENESRFASMLQAQANIASQITPSRAGAEQMTRRMMFWLGFKRDDYLFADGRLEIQNWGNIQQSLAEYRSKREKSVFA